MADPKQEPGREPGEAPPAGEPGAEAAGPAGGLQDALRKALLAGMGAIFLTEEGARRLAREWKLPKELIGFLGSQASGAKDEILRIFSDEVRRFFESEAVRREFARALSSMVVEVKAEIRVRPNDDGTLEPEVKADVKARRAGARKKGDGPAEEG
ncbi:MAG: hypothetical protein IPO09_07375 [Anaeromyxobacter sp.]|nr:hypothetical protein [Anaeromyxobacter sp.]MBL0277926.1 hypothetical protein [Anaeromyxobacter sp.]